MLTYHLRTKINHNFILKIRDPVCHFRYSDYVTGGTTWSSIPRTEKTVFYFRNVH